MRIGIVTQPLEMNYGGILQNWALQQVLKRLGHDPVTIDAYERFSTPHYVFNYMRAKLMRMFGRKYAMPRRYHGATRGEVTGRFIEQNLGKTNVMWHYKRSVVKRYSLDCILVGSDQVWRAGYAGDHLEDMFLRFAAELPIKRVAYAASFGIDNWEYTPEQTRRCSELAKEFDAVSVRETSGVILCRENLGIEAHCVLDPTMLLTADAYNDIIDVDWESKEPYLAVYCFYVTPSRKAFFDRIAKERGLKVRLFSAGWKANLTVEQWLAMFRDASFVVTDSFHGSVFSILFGREFYTLCNKGRGNTRLINLFSQIGLEGRLISDSELDEPVLINIDWAKVRTRLEVLRQESLDFLTNALE